MIEQYEISAMTAEDCKSAAQLTDLYLEVRWNEDMYLAELADSSKHYFAARADGMCVGFIGAQYVLDNADITNIAVKEEFRRKGLGYALFDALRNDAINCGILSLTLEVGEYNTTALAFYGRLGFKQNGYRKNYYREGEGALLLLLEL